MASGISSVATLSTFIGLPVSIQLEAISLAGASVNGMAMALTNKYQNKLARVMKLVDEWEFTTLQTFHLRVLNELANVDCKMEAKIRVQLLGQVKGWVKSTL